MPNWNQVLDEIKAKGSLHDVVRREYLGKLAQATGRNVIAYYSGWLQKPNVPTHINDSDKIGFMSAVHGLDRSKGLDLILHTPGGDFAATESIVYYLCKMFSDIRAIVPQLAMSAGTMMACACKTVLMGKHSNLGPIDPQFGGLPAHGIMEEFETARKEIHQSAANIPLWQPIIAKYNPTLIGECQKAIAWSESTVEQWLIAGMLADITDAAVRATKAKEIVKELGDHSLTLAHNRHLSAEKCREIGLKIDELEADAELQDAVLSVHHTMIHSLSATSAFKIIENHNGIAYIQTQQQQAVFLPQP